MWAGVPGLSFACLTRCLCVPLTLELTPVLGVACLFPVCVCWAATVSHPSVCPCCTSCLFHFRLVASPFLGFSQNRLSHPCTPAPRHQQPRKSH